MELIAGVAVGALAAYVLSNEQAQRTIIRSAVSLWTMLQGGFEEFKERVHDAEAELRHAAEAAGSPPPSASNPPRGDGPESAS